MTLSSLLLGENYTHFEFALTVLSTGALLDATCLYFFWHIPAQLSSVNKHTPPPPLGVGRTDRRIAAVSSPFFYFPSDQQVIFTMPFDPEQAPDEEDYPFVKSDLYE